MFPTIDRRFMCTIFTCTGILEESFVYRRPELTAFQTSDVALVLVVVYHAHILYRREIAIRLFPYTPCLPASDASGGVRGTGQFDRPSIIIDLPCSVRPYWHNRCIKRARRLKRKTADSHPPSPLFSVLLTIAAMGVSTWLLLLSPVFVTAWLDIFSSPGYVQAQVSAPDCLDGSWNWVSLILSCRVYRTSDEHELTVG